MAHAEAEELSLHHRRIRERGTNPWVYGLARAFLRPFLILYFRMRRRGREHLPRVEDPSPHLAVEVTARIWPCVESQWAWLGGPMPHHVEHEEGRERAAA